jgi:hypothetical protein
MTNKNETKNHKLAGKTFIKWMKKAGHYCITTFDGGKQKQVWTQTKPEQPI